MKLVIHIVITVVLFTIETISAQDKTIATTVVNVTSDKGKIKFALYTKENFRKEPLQAKESVIIKGKSTVIFEKVPEGEYAIICFHDANNNNRMDFEPNGMPIEDYGVSNNKLSRFGPPVFDEAKFLVKDKNVSFDIKF
ncbi:DUF2141 domain-containing protein [Tenacibaculum mesophilum]|uniref:DUF2141 domain-containing protein n=1 Tax=Tenacibaculum mesophilum TaxID=104268 RepID=A0AAE9SET0_9FLAO|nr:DUF2141 domain-containing protein [Tenacibaculum mesophilum]UTD14742.1 DUF2141 domain-containing protein [Tenacibaculum mesophilum]GFD76335.1 hypothetical protein KUL113_57550 [Tenacibaculum sp. KUL113]GFD82755.1 hypothetical protein KUL118_56170 [Tenacibaculum sp. KUL118]